MRFSSMFWAVPLLLPGCSAKDAVSLSAQITQPMVTVTEGAFRGSASGSFQVQFKLGPEASGSSTVTPGNFALQTQAGEQLVPVLIVQSDTAFPFVIDKGESKTVTFTFTGARVDHDAACAGQLQFVGSVSDSLKGGADPLRSDLTSPNCGATT